MIVFTPPSSQAARRVLRIGVPIYQGKMAECLTDCAHILLFQVDRQTATILHEELIERPPPRRLCPGS